MKPLNTTPKVSILSRNRLARAMIDANHPVTLAQGDSRKLIERVPSHSVDLILTDPPYNLNGYSTGNIAPSWRKEINNDVAAWDAEEFRPSDWSEEFVRILKPTGNLVAFTSYNLLGKWHETFDPIFDTFQFMVWHKTNPVPKIVREHASDKHQGSD